VAAGAILDLTESATAENARAAAGGGRVRPPD
jgi:hypothetical protein